MKHRTKYLLLFTFVITIVGVCSSKNVFAEAGAVQTKGKVTFYDDTTGSTSSSNSSGTTEPTTPSTPIPSGNSEYPITKPVGKLPSTGELIAKSITITGGILLVLGIVFVLLKSKRGRE